MTKVYIGFSTHPGNLLSGAIRAVEGSSFSHVYIRYVSSYGEFVYQASGLAVNFMNADYFRAHNVIVEEYEFELTKEQRDAMLRFFFKYVGRPYALKQLFQILAILMGRRLGMDVKISGDGEAQFICSELGKLFCEVVLKIEIPQLGDFMTPLDLHPYVAKAGRRVA